MSTQTPSEAEVLRYFDTCSNWGRWGADDELGTLNHLTPAHRRAAAQAVSQGVSVSCARLIPTLQPEEDFQSPPLHFMTASGDGWAGKATPQDALQIAGDFVGLAFHGHAITHVDSLCHIFETGRCTTAARPTWFQPRSGPPSCQSIPCETASSAEGCFSTSPG